MKIVPLTPAPDSRDKVADVLEEARNWVLSPETDDRPNLSCFVLFFEEHPDKVDGVVGSNYFYRDFHYVNSVFGTVGALEVAKNEMLRSEE